MQRASLREIRRDLNAVNRACNRTEKIRCRVNNLVNLSAALGPFRPCPLSRSRTIFVPPLLRSILGAGTNTWTCVDLERRWGPLSDCYSMCSPLITVVVMPRPQMADAPFESSVDAFTANRRLGRRPDELGESRHVLIREGTGRRRRTARSAHSGSKRPPESFLPEPGPALGEKALQAGPIRVVNATRSVHG